MPADSQEHNGRDDHIDRLNEIVRLTASMPSNGGFAYYAYLNANGMSLFSLGLTEAAPKDVRPVERTPMLPVDGPSDEQIIRPESPASLEVWRFGLLQDVLRQRLRKTK